MVGLMLVLFWLVFALVVATTVFLDVVQGKASTLITIFVTPLLAFSLGYVSNNLIEEQEGLSNIHRVILRVVAFGLAVVLAGTFVYLDRIPPSVQVGYCVVLGFTALAMTTLLYERDYRYYSPSLKVEDWIFRIVWLVFVATVVNALFDGTLEGPVTAVTIVLFGTLTLYFTLFVATFLMAGHSVSVESNWGGLGAGLGGWRLSRALVFVLLALFFGLSTLSLVKHSVAVAEQMVSVPDTQLPAQQDDEGVRTDAAAAGSVPKAKKDGNKAVGS